MSASGATKAAGEGGTGSPASLPEERRSSRPKRLDFRMQAKLAGGRRLPKRASGEAKHGRSVAWGERRQLSANGQRA